MNCRLALALAVFLAAPLARAQSLKTDDDKTLYALGAILGGNVKSLSLTKDDVAKVRMGFEDAALDRKLQVEMPTYGPKAQQLAKKRAEENNAREQRAQKEAARGFIEKAVKEPGAQQFPSGLIYRKIRDGSGGSPASTSTVSVNYEGKLVDGTVFDSSYARGEPAEFPLNGVIPCWTEGVQKMKVGEKAQLVCPSNIAYGASGQGSIPPGATLSFTVELLSVK